jgi:hypothetical protein
MFYECPKRAQSKKQFQTLLEIAGYQEKELKEYREKGD